PAPLDPVDRPGTHAAGMHPPHPHSERGSRERSESSARYTGHQEYSMSFESLGLAPALLRALSEQGHVDPTPIQAAAIPLVLEGHDLLASAQTGTGKTAGFALPVLERLFPAGQRTTRKHGNRPRVLVLTPTRELAAQVHTSFRAYGKYLGMHSAVIFGGVKMG